MIELREQSSWRQMCLQLFRVIVALGPVIALPFYIVAGLSGASIVRAFSCGALWLLGSCIWIGIVYGLVFRSRAYAQLDESFARRRL